MRINAKQCARSLAAGAVGIGGLLGLFGLAEYRWRARTAELVGSLNEGDTTATQRVFIAAELEGLPAPAQRYFRTALREGQPVPHQARFCQKGQFLLRPGQDGWRPFTATQHISCRHDRGTVGFVWDARIAVAPGLTVRVRDAFVDGVGFMQASMLGLIPLASVTGTPEIAAGALHRYLAEAAWCPTALLPSQGVVWAPLNEKSARATLQVGEVSVSLDFHFADDGLVQRVFTAARSRDVDGTSVPTPWQGRFRDYARRSGMLVPLSGEVEWLLPHGPQLYWKGRITEAEYIFPALVSETASAPANP
jgi:hypothetical protein